MKVILAVAAVLLAVTHVGDAHGEHTHPHPPYRESVLLVALQMCTHTEARCFACYCVCDVMCILQ